MHKGMRVKLVLPDNDRLDGQLAVVDRLTEWGAHVTTTVGSGHFRALHSEMIPLERANGRESGYTGDACPDCGSFKLMRTGTCVTCQDCGRNEGCS